MTVLAIDQGTTTTRAYVLNADGHGHIVHSLAHRQNFPAAGHVEQDATEILRNIRDCIQAGLATGPIAAIGLDNQGESCLGWDAKTGVPVGPIITWQDSRTASQIARLVDQGAEDQVRASAGLPLDAYFSASKLALIAQTPAARALQAKGRLRLGTTDAFFRDQLTGRFETDPSTASRSSLMSLASCQWDAQLCTLFGVPMECLPKITATTGDLGSVQGIRLTASIVDQQAALFGHGARRAGDTKITFGTGAFALSLCPASPPAGDGKVLTTCAWQIDKAAPTYALDGGVYSAASAVNWARDLGLFEAFSEINSFASLPAISRGLTFVPAQSGLACPHWDRNAQGSWMGIAADTTKSDLVQALLEGIALRVAEVITAMEQVQPIARAISIDGGLSANPYFTQFLADVLGRDIQCSRDPELTAKGCAQLAALGAGLDIPGLKGGTLVAPSGKFDRGWLAHFRAAREAVQGYGRALNPFSER